MCGCDSLVSDEGGDSSGVEVIDDVVVCGDDTLLPDAFRFGGWLSKVGLGMAQPGCHGWTGSFAQTIPCAPSHHLCTQCVCVVVYWQPPDIIGTWRLPLPLILYVLTTRGLPMQIRICIV